MILGCLGTTSEHLGGPLAGINALNCSNESQVNQFVRGSIGSLRLKVDDGRNAHQPGSSYVAEVLTSLFKRRPNQRRLWWINPTTQRPHNFRRSQLRLLIEAATGNGSVLNVSGKDLWGESTNESSTGWTQFPNSLNEALSKIAMAWGRSSKSPTGGLSCR